MTNRAIAVARLRNSRLIPDRDLPALNTPADVVRWFGAVQSQDVPGASWALAQRLPAGVTSEDVGGAFDRGEFVRTHAMRPTWHFLAPEDLRWIQALTSDRVHRLNGTLQRQLGVSDADFDRATGVIREAMTGARALTREELRSTLSAARFDVSNNLMTIVLGMHAELEAVMCNGPRRGKQIPFLLVDDWIAPTPPRSRDDSLRELTIRYFTSHGPALVKDMAWWSGLPLRDVRRGVELAGAALAGQSIDGQEYVAAPDGFEPGRLTSPHVLLLSNYDEYLGSYADYSPIYDRSLPRARNVADVLGAHIVVRDGLVVGGWRRAIGPKQLTVTVTLLAELSTDECDALAAEAETLGRFFGLAADLRIVPS